MSPRASGPETMDLGYSPAGCSPPHSARAGDSWGSAEQPHCLQVPVPALSGMGGVV